MKNGFPLTINMKVNTKSLDEDIKKAKSAVERLEESMKEETKVEIKSNFTTPEEVGDTPIFWNHDVDDVIGNISEDDISRMREALIKDMPSRKKATTWIPRVKFYAGAWNLFYVGAVWDIEEYTLHVSLIPMVVVSFDFRATMKVREFAMEEFSFLSVPSSSDAVIHPSDKNEEK